MPEIVEVHISAQLIKPLIENQKIHQINIAPNSRYHKQTLEGLTEFNQVCQSSDILVQDIQTKGKLMYWTFSQDRYLLCTFGMTGQWSPIKGKHPCIEVKYGNNQSIFFNDPRHFGTVKLIQGNKNLKNKLGELGWDPLKEKDHKVWLKYLTNQIKNSSKPIAQIMLDQSLFAGIGNYLRAEILYDCQISPWRLGKNLTPNEIENICQSSVKMVQASLDHQGATLHTYKDAYGNEGKYSSYFKVYSQKQDPSGNKVITETTPEGRTIHWCPTVQK